MRNSKNKRRTLAKIVPIFSLKDKREESEKKREESETYRRIIDRAAHLFDSKERGGFGPDREFGDDEEPPVDSA